MKLVYGLVLSTLIAGSAFAQVLTKGVSAGNAAAPGVSKPHTGQVPPPLLCEDVRDPAGRLTGCTVFDCGTTCSIVIDPATGGKSCGCAKPAAPVEPPKNPAQPPPVQPNRKPPGSCTDIRDSMGVLTGCNPGDCLSLICDKVEKKDNQGNPILNGKGQQDKECKCKDNGCETIKYNPPPDGIFAPKGYCKDNGCGKDSCAYNRASGYCNCPFVKVPGLQK